ncbi:MAG: Na/Pi cotransporter family protein, partial [Clostridia bacterium]|nr:Na/Pi cotransporter family protein [Clostridia bacterium]
TPFLSNGVWKAAVAHIHTLFNLTFALLLLPFRSLLVRLSERFVPEIETEEAQTEEERLLALLDPRFTATPAIALEQCRKVIRAMGQKAFANVRMATTGIVDHSQLDHEVFMQNEAFLDTCEARINTYLLTLKDASLSDSCQRAYTEIQHTVGEFEQIGDYAENLHERYDSIRENNIHFSADAVCEIGVMSNALEEMSTLTLESFENSDGTLSDCIGALEEVIDVLKETLKDKHIQRLQQGLCTVENGIPFLDIIHDLEKIADHCSNISIYVLMYDDGVTSFDIHEYHRMADEAIENHSQQWQEHYEERYLRPILGERAE